MTANRRIGSHLWLVIVFAFTFLTACTEGDESVADAADSDADGSDTGENVIPTHYFRAVAVSGVYIRGADTPAPRIDFGDRLLGEIHFQLYASDDAGETWTTVSLPVSDPSEQALPGMMLNATTGSVLLFSNYSRLFRSVDRGQTFTALTSPFPREDGSSIRSLAIGSDGSVWALRHYNTTTGYGLAVSTDDGETFEDVDLPFEAEDEAEIAGSFGVKLFAGPSGSVYLSVNKEKLYRRTLDVDWQLVDGVLFTNEHFVREPDVMLIPFHELGTYKLALSTDEGKTFAVTTLTDPLGFNETFAQLEDATLLRISKAGQLRVLSADANSWDEVVSAYPEEHESPYITQVDVDASSITLTYEYEILRWSKGDDEWTTLESPQVLPIGADVDDTTVIASGKAAVIVTKNSRSVIYVSDDGGETWRRGQRFNEPVLTLAMKPEGDQIFVGGGGGRVWYLDGNGMLPDGRDPSITSTRYGPFPLLQSVWTPNFGRNSYLLVVGADADDRDGALYRLTYYTDLMDLTELDPLRDPVFPARDNPAGMRSISYTGRSITVALRAFVGQPILLDHVRTAINLSDWTDSPIEFDEESRRVPFGIPIRMTSKTSEDCKMFGQLYDDGQLYDGGYPAEITEWPSLVTPRISDIECGPGGVWWVATDLGLYRLERLPEPE